MTFVWESNPSMLDDDVLEFDQMVEGRKVEIINDMNACGFPFVVWTTWQDEGRFYSRTNWLSDKAHQISNVSFTDEVCFGFKDNHDALMFKLMI